LLKVISVFCLAHPHIQVFMAHGRLQGIQGVHNCRVSIVGIPVHCDRFLHMARSVFIIIGVTGLR